MRCKNCGWENPDTVQRCVKCNSPLTESRQNINQTERQFSPMENNNLNLKSTVREVQSGNDVPSYNPPQKENNKKCNKCGYPLAENMDECPMCGSFQGKEEKIVPKFNARNATVNNWVNPNKGVFCTLKPVAWENEGVEHNPISYSGDRIVLNRSNTDANNNSITSKEQAVLTFENNEWYIENASEMKTTFIQVNGKTKLKSGDIIVLGNRLFEFKD